MNNYIPSLIDTDDFDLINPSFRILKFKTTKGHTVNLVAMVENRNLNRMYAMPNEPYPVYMFLSVTMINCKTGKTKIFNHRFDAFKFSLEGINEYLDKKLAFIGKLGYVIEDSGIRH
jgi:hypothetical protein